MKDLVMELEALRKQLRSTMDKVAEALAWHGGEFTNQAFETWVARIDTAINHNKDFDVPFQDTMEGFIKALRDGEFK